MGDVPKGTEGREATLDTLFIAGGNSPYIPESAKETMSSQFPSYRLATIPDAGHWVHYEKPSEFLSTLEQFFQR